MSSMKQTRHTFAGKWWQIRREKKWKYFGQLAPTTKWLWWHTVMLQSGKCTKIPGILFQVSYLSVFTLTTTWVCPTLGLSTSRTPEFTTWWQKIKFTSQRASDLTHQRRTLTAQKTCGDLRRILQKRMLCAIQNGILRTPTTTSITETTSREMLPEKTFASTESRDETFSVESPIREKVFAI